MLGATSFGRITHLYVKEGDQVKRGAILATIENVQPEATVSAQQAAISASRTDITSYTARRKDRRRQCRRSQSRPRAEDSGLRPLPTALPKQADCQAGLRRQGRRPTTCPPPRSTSARPRSRRRRPRPTPLAAMPLRRWLPSALYYDALDKTVSRAPFDWPGHQRSRT